MTSDNNPPFYISTDKTKLDISIIHNFLSKAYWSEGIPVAIIEKGIEHSFCFGVYREEEQVGFARVITDYATFAYLADVFIVESYQGHGLGKKLVDTIVNHPSLKEIRTFSLFTKDAHGLYTQYGFKVIEDDLAMRYSRFSKYE